MTKEHAVDEYNSTYNDTIGNEPKVVKKTMNSKVSKFLLNHYVRISIHKELLSKVYTPIKFNEVFKIINLMKNISTTYNQEDYEGNQIKGGFYIEELENDKHPDNSFVEIIMRIKQLYLTQQFHNWTYIFN